MGQISAGNWIWYPPSRPSRKVHENEKSRNLFIMKRAGTLPLNLYETQTSLNPLDLQFVFPHYWITGLTSRDLVAAEAWYHCQCCRDYTRPDKACKYSDLSDEPDSDESNYCNIESQAYEKLFEFI